MRTITFIVGVFSFALFSCWMSYPAAAQGLDKVEIKTTPLGGGIYMLEGAGGNLGVSAGADGIFLIDDQYAPLTGKILAAIRKISDKPVRFVLNTHWHGDHTGGNENLAKAGVLILAHDRVRARLGKEQFMEAFNRRVPPLPKEALPVVTFNDSIIFHLNGEAIKVFHVPPAHTDGDSIVHFPKANVVHMGDTFFNGLYPFIDISAGGSVNGMIAAVGRVLKMIDDDTKVIPGHGPLASRKDLAAFQVMLEGVRDQIAPMVKAGKSLEEVLAKKPTAEFDAVWGKGFLKPEQFAGIVYESLRRGG